MEVNSAPAPEEAPVVLLIYLMKAPSLLTRCGH
jgi:hypothetical protein